MVRYKVQLVPRNVSFKDHAGKPAWMSWTSNTGATIDLPQLHSWVFYMTNPKISHVNFDGHAFKRGVENLDDFTDSPACHYEFFFLPNATTEECVAHFRAEMKARGTVWNQIREVAEATQFQKQNWQKLRRSRRLNSGSREEEDKKIADALASLPRHKESYGSQVKDHQKLPGLCWPLRENACLGEDYKYQGGLFMYPHDDVSWNHPDDLSREVCLVNFDPLPQIVEEGDSLSFDPMEHPIHPQWIPVGQKRKYINDIKDFQNDITEYLQNAFRWMGDFEYAGWRIEASDATGRAEDLGWQSW